MAREIFGWSGADVVQKIDVDGDYNPATATFDVMTTRTGSTAHTNLLDMSGGAITTVTPDSDGWIRFQGQDGYKGSYWLRDQAQPSNPRWRIDPAGMAERLIAVEGGATALPSATDGQYLKRVTGAWAGDDLTADDVADGTTNKSFLATERTKLSGIATGATANPDLASIAGSTEAVQDIVGAFMVEGNKIDLTYDDAGAGTVTISHLEPTPRTITGAATLALGDANAAIYDTGGSANVLTVPTNAAVAFPTDTQVEVWALGAGALTITAASGVTLNGVSAGTYAPAQYARTVLRKTGTNAWVANGDANAVKLTTDQFIDGTKTFLDAPVVPNNSFSMTAIAGLAAALDGKLAIVMWDPGTNTWGARGPDALVAAFISTMDVDATASTDVDLVLGDFWLRHPDAPPAA